MKTQCENCGRVLDYDQLEPVMNPLQRVAPGEIMPYGECPDCGAVCHALSPTTLAEQLEGLKQTIRTARAWLAVYKKDSDNATHAKRMLGNAIHTFDGGDNNGNGKV